MEELEHRLAADEEVVRVALHMQLCTSRDFVRHVERRATSCEGQDIQAAIPLIYVNKETRNSNRKVSTYRKAEYL